MSSSECPALETLAWVLDGAAPDETRDRVLDHLATCETCYRIYAETARRQIDRRARTTRRLAKGVAAGIAVVATGLVLAWAVVYEPSLDERPVELLVEAVQGRRLLEARLTGGFSGAGAGRPTLAFDTVGDSRERWKLADAALQVDRLARRRPSPGRIEALGVAHLLNGDLDTASLLIQEALDRKPNDPVFLTDLAATHYSRYEEGVPEALIEALAAAESAVDMEPDSPEALFNRALALSTFQLRGEGRLAWRRYAAVETRSDWIEEARQREATLTSAERELASAERELDPERLAALDGEELRAEVAAHPQAVRTYLQETLLARWGREWLDGDPSRQLLQLAERVADALQARTSDPMLQGAVEEIRSAPSDRVDHLARGHAAFGAARHVFEALSPGESQPLFAEAQRELEAARSPYALWARFWQAGCAYYQGEPHTEILAELGSLREEAGNAGYEVLLARALWLEGLVHFVDLEIPESLEAYTKALDLFERAGEDGHAAFLHYLVSENYLVLGDLHHGWQHRIHALEIASDTDTGNKYPGILLGTGFAALMQGHEEAALKFFEEAARVADDEVAQTEAGLWRARTLASLGKGKKATRSLELARARLARIRSAPVRKRLRAEASIVTSVIEEDPTLALGHIGEALTYFRASGPDFRLPLLHLERARVLLETGDRESALADLETGFKQLRGKAESPVAHFYLSAFDGANELVDLLVEFQALESPDRAFTTAEAERGMMLPAPTLREIQRQLPRTAAMLYYFVHEQTLLVWTVTHTETSLTTKTVHRDELERLMQRFLRSFSLNPDLASDPGRELSEILLADALPDVSTLVIVPDGPLAGLPFSALPSPRTGRYVAEDAAVQVAPSASHYLHAQRQKDRDTRVADSLVVGSPRLDPRLFPGLPSLPNAFEEARRVASLYGSAEVLLQSAATRRAFLRKAPDRDVIHYSGPGMSRAQFSFMNGLVFSPKRDESPVVLAHEIASLDLSDVRLVVLTGDRNTRLAKAFLEAGVPSVLASLWPLDDSRVVESFHRHFLEGLPPAQALRTAQLEAIPDARSSWAAFQLLGS